MMCKKIAFYLTLVSSAVLLILRLDALTALGTTAWAMRVALLMFVAVIALCVPKKAEAVTPSGRLAPISGWMSTFCGAVMALSVVLDVFCWAAYDQLPPPTTYIINGMDRMALYATLLFGLAGGVFLILQGFSWMAGTDDQKNARAWLSLAPVLWMWFRLARYEISYASTIDIRESFFDFASLVLASLFFLQFARLISGVGKPPKNSLLIFSLCTAMTTLSGIPLAFEHIADGRPLGTLLAVIVDGIVGLFALCVGAVQVFGKNGAEETTEAEPVEDVSADYEGEALAWRTPAKDVPPVEPAFEIGNVLPTTEAPKPEEVPATPTPSDNVDIDALLQEITDEQDAL